MLIYWVLSIQETLQPIWIVHRVASCYTGSKWAIELGSLLSTLCGKFPSCVSVCCLVWLFQAGWPECKASGHTRLKGRPKVVSPVETGVCRLDQPLRAGGRRANSTINTVVLHHTAINTFAGSISTLRSRGLSYHYLIDRDGLAVSTVPTPNVARHAAGANRASIGISLVGGATPDWAPSAQQWEATKRLLRRLAASYPSLRYVMGHGDIRDTNRGEPYGVSFEKLMAELEAKSRVRLVHPRPVDEPLRTYREAALRLQARPLTTGPAPKTEARDTELVICPGENKHYFSVPNATQQK